MRFYPLALIGLIACGGSEPIAAPPEDQVAKKPEPPPRGTRFPAKMKTHRWLMHTQPCGQNCELTNRGYSAAQVSFGTNGKVSLEDKGELQQRFRASHGKRRAKTTWTRHWSGGWSLGEDRLHLTFELADENCQRDEAGAGANCDPAPQSFELDCLRRRVKLHRPERKVVWSWICDNPKLDLATDHAMTPLPWVFAETTEVVALDKGARRAPFRRYVRVDATPPTKTFYR